MRKTICLLMCIIIALTMFPGFALASGGQETKTFTSLSDFKEPGARIGVVTGMSTDQECEILFPEAELKYFNNSSDMVFALRNGMIDGYMEDETVAKYMVSCTDGITVIDDSIGASIDAAFAFGKTDFDMKLLKECNEYLLKIKADGTLQEIIRLWNGTDESRQVLDYPTEGENGVIKVCTFAESAPASFVKDGLTVGFEIDILTRFCREYGYSIEISRIDFSGLLNGVESGIYNIACGYISVTEERKESVNFSESYINSALAMIVRAPSEEKGFFDNLRDSFESTFIKESRWKLIVDGIKTTLIISVFAAILGTLLGFGLCMLRRLKNKVVHGITTVYIRIFQGTPILVMLMILFYIVFAKSGISGEIVAIIAFALNFAAYVCEMFRTGIDGVDRGQTEAALALGYTRAQTFFGIVMPQAAANFLPVYKGEFISLVKMTSVVGYIAVQDLTKMSDIIRSRTFEAFFPLIATAVIYFVLAALLTALLKTVEVKVNPKRKIKTLKGVTMK